MSVNLSQVLFSPRRVALIGVSDDPSKTSARPLLYLGRSGYSGSVYPVNPRRDTVLGRRAWRNVGDLPERPDHAFIVTATDAVLDAVEQCGEAGIPVATILANGFSEAGREGREREERLAEIAHRHGIRIVGPSSLGIVNFRDKLLLTANAAFDEPDFPTGRTFCATQSGSLIGAIATRGKARGIGFAGLVSVGSEVDLGVGEICAALLDDPNIDNYVLFLENLRKAGAIRDFALRAARRGKPVIVYKLGRSQAARELAVSHTGALAGEDDVASMFFRECGIARVGTFEGLIEAPLVLQRMAAISESGKTPTVGVVTTTGGGAAMVVDQLELRGITVASPSDETWQRLQQRGVGAERGRIVDLTLAGTRYDVMSAALQTMLEAGEYDMILAVVGSSARFRPELAVAPIIDSAGHSMHLAAFIAPDAPEAHASLARAGVPSFSSPEVCADTIAAALGRRTPRIDAGEAASEPSGESRLCDEIEGYERLGQAGIPCAPAFAMPAAPAGTPDLPFPYPVVMKILSSAIAHKSDVGGVALGIADAAQLLEQARMLPERVRKSDPELVVDRLLVQPLVDGVGEVLIGYQVHGEVGPLVLLAPGGVLAELGGERSTRLAPVDLATAREMIGEVKALRSLAGFRNRPEGDLEALAQAIVDLSGLAHRPEIVEAEINPLIVRRRGGGVIAVDALVRCRV